MRERPLLPSSRQNKKSKFVVLLIAKGGVFNETTKCLDNHSSNKWPQIIWLQKPKKWPICLQGKYQTEKGNYWRSLDHRRIIERKQKCGGWYVICGGKWMERLEGADQCLYCWHLGWARVAPARWSLLDHPHNSLMPVRLISSNIIIRVRRSSKEILQHPIKINTTNIS